MPERTTLESAGDRLRWTAGALTLDLVVDPSRPVQLVALLPSGQGPGGAGGDTGDTVPLVELDLLGSGRVGDSASAQHRPYAAAARLRYSGHEEQSETGRRTLLVHQRDDERGLTVTSRLQAWGDTAVLRADTAVVNTGSAPVTLTYVSSLSLGGFGGGLGADTRIHEARNAWIAELRWQELTPEQAGLVGVRPLREGHGTTRGRHAVTATGSWSSADFLPMGAVENRRDGLTWAWQVEHQASWHWEVGDLREDLYLLVSGPTDHEHHWQQRLAPGDTFRSVPVAVTVSEGTLHDALRALTTYRRPADDSVANAHNMGSP